MTLAQLCTDVKDLERAESLLVELLPREGVIPRQRLKIADDLVTLGVNWVGMQNHAAAQRVLRTALKVYEKGFPNELRRFVAQSLLGGSLMEAGQDTESGPFLSAGYEGLKEAGIKLSNDKTLRLALQHLVGLYEAHGHVERAAQWRELLSPIADKD